MPDSSSSAQRFLPGGSVPCIRRWPLHETIDWPVCARPWPPPRHPGLASLRVRAAEFAPPLIRRAASPAAAAFPAPGQAAWPLQRRALVVGAKGGPLVVGVLDGGGEAMEGENCCESALIRARGRQCAVGLVRVGGFALPALSGA
jgi:hypothetical protein